MTLFVQKEGKLDYKYSGPRRRTLVWAQREPWTQTALWTSRPLRCRLHFHAFKYTPEGEHRRCPMCGRKERLNVGSDSWWSVDYSPADFSSLDKAGSDE